MKVTLINSSDTGGGAPVACRRLMNALNLSQDTATMLVQRKSTALPAVEEVLKGSWGSLVAQANFLYERIPFIALHEKDKSVRFAFSEANSGTDISKHPMVQEADILHIHWTNRGFLSLKDIGKLLDLNKPTVWTLHDMWAFTGGCHYTGGCEHFLQNCGHCPMLRDQGENDLSRKGWNRKKAIYQGRNNLQIVTCSNWLADVARSSSLFREMPIQAIPNPIDTDLYKPVDRTLARRKWSIAPEAKVILFGAANINDKRKGLSYLIDALEIHRQSSAIPVEVVMFGKNKHFDPGAIPFKVHMLPSISSEADLIELYNMADIFVHPSLEDNLPNMVMEAMACGTPVLAFRNGGLPDLIDHMQNGYLAEYRSASDFSAGISWLLASQPSYIREAARNKITATFNNQRVASQYQALYSSILSEHA